MRAKHSKVPLNSYEKLTNKFNDRLESFAILRPFKVDAEQLELLEPLERIEIEGINNDKRKGSTRNITEEEKEERLFLLTCIFEKLSNNSKLFFDEAFINNIIKPWMDIFLSAFERDYYDESELVSVLRKTKEIFKLFKDINDSDFVPWYARFSTTFIKAALFKIQLKLYKEALKNKKRFTNKMKDLLGKNLKEDKYVLSFGKSLLFFKDFNKSFFTEIDEEINLVQEMYFNSTFGPNQLKNNYLIDWELQQKEIELQEYFFNIKNDFIKLGHALSNTKVDRSNNPELTKIKERIKVIERDFVEISIPKRHSDRGQSNYPKLSQRNEFGNPIDSEEAAPLAGPSSPFTGFRNERSEPLSSPMKDDNKRRDSDAKVKSIDVRIHNMFGNIKKLTDILREINSIIKEDKNSISKKKHRAYIEIRTGSIIGRATQLIESQNMALSYTINDSEWEDFKKALAELLFDSRIYLSMFSNNSICHFVEVMPEQSIKILLDASVGCAQTLPDDFYDNIHDLADENNKKIEESVLESRPYKKCFNKLIKVYLRWVMLNTINFKEQTEYQKDYFYVHITSVLKFFDKMICFFRKTDVTIIQPEILYFDFLFAVYHYSNAKELLKNFSENENRSPRARSDLNRFFTRLETSPSYFSPDKIIQEGIENSELSRNFVFLSSLLGSMKLATNRYTLTDYSHLLKAEIGNFVHELLNFSNCEDLSIGDSQEDIIDINKKDKTQDVGIWRLIQNKEIDDRLTTFKQIAEGNNKMENIYYYMLYNLVVRLQTNLIFNTDENIMDNPTLPQTKTNMVGRFDVSWRPSESKLIDIAQNNFIPILSQSFQLKKENLEEGRIFHSSIKAAIHQAISLVKKFEIGSITLDDTSSDKLKRIKKNLQNKLALFNRIIHEICQVLGCDLQEDPTKEDELASSIKQETSFWNLIEEILQGLSRISDTCNLGLKPGDYRRDSIHSDQSNLKMLSLITKHSKKYNPAAANISESYYLAILAGRVEMEIDAKELNMGLARSFIKIFNKMLLDQPKYKRRFRKINASIEGQVKDKFDFIYTTNDSRMATIEKLKNERDKVRAEKGSLLSNKSEIDHKIEDINILIGEEEVMYEKEQAPVDYLHQFILAYETNYFYNEVYTRAIILYEKLIDEVPELKHNIYNESYKNKGLINFELSDEAKFNRTYPYLHNLYTLGLSYSYHLFTSVIFNVKWGISISRCFIILSLLNNLTLDNFQGFKELYAEVPFEDSQLTIFKEIPEMVPPVDIEHHAKGEPHEGQHSDFKPLDSRAEKFEEEHQSFIVSLCCRIERFLYFLGFYDKGKLNKNLTTKIVTTAMPILTIALNFLDISVLTVNSPLMRNSCSYIYHKLFTRYLLQMLFGHDDISKVDVMYLKKSIASLLFKLMKNQDVIEDLLKYQFDLRAIYDYTLKISKVHIASHLKEGNWLKRIGKSKADGVEEINKDDKSVLKLLSKIGSAFKQYSKKFSKSIFSFDHFPTLQDNKLSKDNIQKCNSNLFGGFNFSYIKNRHHQRQLETGQFYTYGEIMECYKQSDNRDLGFQFINSLVKIMGYIEFSTGLKLWSSKKETARVQFEIEPTKLPKNKLYELTIVYFLSMTNKQIEVVGIDGKNVLINFRKYPEIYTLESLNPLDLISEFKFEDFKRDVCKIIPELYVKTNIQYNLQQKMGFWYTFMKSDSTKRQPVFLWLVSVILNMVIIGANVNFNYRPDTFTYRNNSLYAAEKIISLISLALSGLLLLMIGYARYMALKISRKTMKHNNMTHMKRSNDVFKEAMGKFARLFSFFFDNPYYTFIKNLLIEPQAFQIFLQFTFTLLGLVVHKLCYSFGLLMFIFFSKTTRHVLKSITTNSDEITIAVVILLLMAYIMTIIQFFYFYDDFNTNNLGNNLIKPCVTLYDCYLVTVNYGLRFGGGLAENTFYIPEYSSRFEGSIAFDLIFFLFLNIIGMNMIFGIIIDTFGELRDIEQRKDEILSNKCLICGIEKTEFESIGINFAYHVKVQHNVEDYVAYLIRLNINKNNLQHGLDYYIFRNYLKQNVSWFPNKSTIFRDQITQMLRDEEEKKQQSEEAEAMKKLEEINRKVQSIRDLFKKLEEDVVKRSDSLSPSYVSPNDEKEIHIRPVVKREQGTGEM